MAAEGVWWTSPQQADNGSLVMVTGHDCLDKFINSGKYDIRIDVSWKYEPLPDGMPDLATSQLMEKVTDALSLAFSHDKVAVMTGIYTGDGQRDWVFYTKNLKIFGTVFNKALSDLPTIPISIDAEHDPDWEEYRNMRDISYIPDGD